MSEAELRAEIAALRREIAAMRTERPAAEQADPAEQAEAENAAEAGVNSFADQLHALTGEIAAFAEEAEKGVVKHPLAGVLGAFLLGILIGRGFHR